MTCLAGDFMGDYSFDKPLEIGDKIVFDDMIHYTMVKTTTFNGVNLPSIGIWKEIGRVPVGEIVRLRKFQRPAELNATGWLFNDARFFPTFQPVFFYTLHLREKLVERKHIGRVVTGNIERFAQQYQLSGPVEANQNKGNLRFQRNVVETCFQRGNIAAGAFGRNANVQRARAA